MDDKLGRAMKLLGALSPELGKILQEIRDEQVLCTSNQAQIVEEDRQAVVPVHTLSAPSIKLESNEYVPLRRPRRFTATKTEEPGVPIPVTEAEEASASKIEEEARSLEARANSEKKDEEEVLDQGSSTTDKDPDWGELEREFSAASTAVWEAHARAERILGRIWLARQNYPEIRAQSEDSEIRGKFQILDKVTSAMKSARDLELNRQMEAEENARRLQEQRKRVVEAEAALQESRRYARKKQAELDQARKEALFTELRISKKENKI